jgi:methyl-accepting chemotaxis protein
MKLLGININSYKNKLIFLISASLLLVILVIGIYALIRFRKITLDNSRETVELIAENYAEKISDLISRNYQLTNTLAASACINNDNIFESNSKNTPVFNILLSDKMPDDMILTELFLFENENGATNQNNNEKSPNKLHQFTYKQGKELITELRNISIEQNFVVPPEVARDGETVFQSPKHIQAGKNKHFSYAVIAPLIKDRKYAGYIRMFFSVEPIYETINKVTQFRGQIRFIIASEKEYFIAVSNKKYLSGKDIRMSNTAEGAIFQAVISDTKISESGNKLTAFSKIEHPYSPKKWLLINYIPNEKIIAELIGEIYKTVLMAAAIILIALTLIILNTLNFFKKLENYLLSTEKMAKGSNISFKGNTEYTELNRLSQALNAIIDRRKEIYETANAIQHDNYLRNLEALSDDDLTAPAINQINKKLQQIEAENDQRETENEIRNWQRKGQLEIAEIQRTGSNETEDLSFNLIRTLVKYTEALLGAIYIKRFENSGKAYLELSGAYAFEERRNLDTRFQLGESIVGTCALEKKKIYLDNLPDNYIKIGSGMGSGKPSFLGVFPIFSQEKLVAVSEIGFMKRPEEYKLNFIEQLGENIGAWLSAAENQKRTRKLLNISQEKTRELSEKEAELDSMLKAINRTVLTVQYAPDGKFISANELYYETTGYNYDDLKDTNVLDLVKDQKEELIEIIEKVTRGESIEQSVTRYTKSGEAMHMKATYSPYYNSEGKITRVIFFGIKD